MPQVFSKKGEERLADILTHFPNKRAALLSALRLAEAEFGAIDNEALEYVADKLDLHPAHVYGVFTFYSHYRRPEHGTYVIDVCCTLPCALRGARDIVRHLVDRLGIEPGETTSDGMFTLRKVECLAACDHAPMAQVNFRDYHLDLTPELVDELIDTLRAEATETR